MCLNLGDQYPGAATAGTVLCSCFMVWCRESNRVCEPRALDSAAKAESPYGSIGAHIASHRATEEGSVPLDTVRVLLFINRGQASRPLKES